MPAIVANQGAVISSIGHIAHATSGVNSFGPFLPLATGDSGMTKIDSVTLSAAAGLNTYGTLVLVKPLLELPITTAFVMSERNYMNQLPSMPRIYDGAYLGFLYNAGAATAINTNFYGYLDVAWG
jgi:hypothetical protein